jgi:phosphopantetheinyl transferase (holo-ACP synthase)
MPEDIIGVETDPDEVVDPDVEEPEGEDEDQEEPESPTGDEDKGPIPYSRFSEVIAERNLEKEETSRLREENRRLLELAQSHAPKPEVRDADPNADILELGYDPEYMTDNEIAIARNQAADRKLVRELLKDKETSQATQKYNQEIQSRYLAQVDTISECEDKPLTDTQRNEILQHALRLAPTKTDKSPEQLATLAVAAWKKTKTDPKSKIRDGKSVLETGNRSSQPGKRAIIPDKGEDSDTAIRRALKENGIPVNV